MNVPRASSAGATLSQRPARYCTPNTSGNITIIREHKRDWNIVHARRLPRRPSPEKRPHDQRNRRATGVDRQDDADDATVKEFRRMGADTEEILRLLQFFVDELGEDGADRDEDDDERLE